MVNEFFDFFDTNHDDRLGSLELERLLRKMYDKRGKGKLDIEEMAY
jgi:Ca2+-binding EF-hand superfamily protein